MKTHDNNVKEYIQSINNKHYALKNLDPLKKTQPISIKQLPQGITILEETNLATANQLSNHSIQYGNNTIAATDYLLLTKTAPSKRGQHFRNALKLWKSIFNCHDNIIYQNGSFSVRMHTNITTFSSISNRYEVYFPLAFINNEQPMGGAFIYLWITGKNTLPTSEQLPISIFQMGSCLFGGMLYGIDEQLQKHLLTDPCYKIPNESLIPQIENSIPCLHYKQQQWLWDSVELVKKTTEKIKELISNDAYLT